MEDRTRSLWKRVKTLTLNIVAVLGFVILIAILHARTWQVFDLLESIDLIS